MDHSGNESEAELFSITIQRDTDQDGTPDVDDDDDDNDGYTDEEEIEAGTNPKDDTDVPGDEEEADTTAPDAPTVQPVTDESTEVIGEAEPNTDVTVTLPNGEIVTGRTDEDGDFVIVLPEDLELNVGDELTVVVTDEAGNSSEPIVVVVTDGSTSETPTDPENPDENGNTPGENQGDTSTGGNNGAGGNDQGNGSSTGGGQNDDAAGGKNQESHPQTGESQSKLTIISGSVMSAIGALMLAWNKRKKGITKRK